MSSVPNVGGAHQSRRNPVRPAHGLARLLLVVNGTSYTIRTIACDPSAALKAYRLRKADGTAYNVALTEYGPVCDCPDYTFHRDGIDPDGCKHIKAMTVVGLLESGERRCRMKTAINASNGHVSTLPANGQPTSLIELVEHEAIGYRAWETPEGDFLARQMDRLAQLIRWTGATTPDEHEDRMEVWDQEIREQHFDRGYSEGCQAARNMHGHSPE